MKISINGKDVDKQKKLTHYLVDIKIIFMLSLEQQEGE